MPQKSSARARPFAAREEGTNSGGEKVAECGAAVIFICAGGGHNLDDHLPREARVCEDVSERVKCRIRHINSCEVSPKRRRCPEN